jgi:hypothetical protein
MIHTNQTSTFWGRWNGQLGEALTPRRRKFTTKLCLLVLMLISFSALSQTTNRFNDGYLTAFRVTSGAALANTGTAIVLDEYHPTTTGQTSPNYSVTLPTSGGSQIVVSGTAGSAGQITRSEDGRLLVIPGYNNAVGAANTLFTTTNVARLVDPSGTVSAGLTGGTAYFTGNNNLRGATTDDGTNVWLTGGAVGLVYCPIATPAAPVTVSTTSTNTRYVFIQNGQLYFTTGAGSQGVYRVGTGKPTTTGTTSVRLFTPTATSVQGAALSPDGNTLYYIVDGVNGVYRSTFDGTTWTAGTQIAAVSAGTGLAVDWSGYAFNLTGANGARIFWTIPASLQAANDNGTSTVTISTLRTLTGNNAFRGLAFSPVRQTVSLGTNTPAAGNVSAGSTDQVLFQFSLASTEGNTTLRALTIANTGTATLGAGNDLTNFRLIIDSNNDGIAQAGELSSPLGTASVNGSNILFSGINTTYANLGSTVNYLLVGNFSSSATNGNTFIPSIATNRTINAVNFTTSVVNASQAPVRIGTTAPTGNTITITGATPNVTIAAAHPAAGDVNQGSTDNIIATISLASAVSAATLTDIAVTTAGTYSITDATNFKFWIGPNAGDLSGATQLGTTLASVASGGSLSRTGLSGSIPSGATRYVHITVSVASGAVVGNTFSIASTDFSAINFVAANKLGTNPIAAGNAFSVQSIPPAVVLADFSPLAGNINQGSVNQLLYTVRLGVSNAPAELTEVSFTTGGTYQISDLQTNGFKVWINSVNSLTGATQLGASQAIVASGGVISITGLTQSLPIGFRFILVTCDVAFGADPSRNIFIDSTPAGNFVFTSASVSGGPIAAGGVQTFNLVVPNVALARLFPTSAANLNIPVTNAIVYQFSVAPTLNGATLNQVTFPLAGTYVTGNLVATTFKLWFNTTNTFGTATQIGTSQAIVASGGNVVFSGLTQNVNISTTGFFWLTVDANNTGNANTINVAAVPFTNFVFANANITGVSPLAAGAIQTLNLVPVLTEVIVPQFALSGGTTNARLPYVCRLQLTNLSPGATYRYLTVVGGGTAGNMFVINNVDNPAFGNYITGQTSSKNLNTGIEMGSTTANENTGAARYGTFTADGSGQYTGWFSLVATGNAAFNPGNNITFGLQLNNGAGGTTVANSLQTTSTITMLAQDNTLPNGSQALIVTSDATPENMIFLYDNPTGTGRPIAGTWAENDGIASGFSAWYSANTESGNGRFATVIPRNLANGIRFIEQRSVATGAVAGCSASDSDGIWTGVWGSTNTVNPAGTTLPSTGLLYIGSVTPTVQQGIAFTTPTWYLDSDSDGFGDPSTPLTQCTQPGGYVADNTDCNDANAQQYPAADADGDGFTRCQGDCNDGNAAINPGAAEICDLIDNNCNGSVDETLPNWYSDNDGDGFGAGAIQFTQCANPGAGFVTNNTDCDDNDIAVTQITWYQDQDNDNYSNGNTLIQCTQPVGYKLAGSLTAITGDCDDNNSAINPATLWYQDADSDGFGNPSVTLASCTQPVGYLANSSDCNDASSAIRPTATEVACNGIDENCNGTIDGDAAGAILGCTDPSASNYNASANCDNGGCTYAQSFTTGNVVVSRIVGTTNGASRIVLEEYNTSTANQSSPAEFISIPNTGPTVLTNSGSATSEGQITRSPDGQSIVLAGYAAYTGVSSVASTLSASTPRAIGTVDINYSYSRVATTNTLYNTNNIRSATRSGNNFWAAGPRNGVTYLGTGAPDSVSNSIQQNNFRVVQVVNGKLYASTSGSNGFHNRGILRIGTGLPTTNGQSVTQVINNAGNNSSMYAFHFNQEETLCYIADDGTGGAGGGIQRWSFNGTNWVLDYNMALGAGVRATGVWADFYGAANPVIYAVTTDNRLVRFNDTGVLVPTLTTLSTAPVGSSFRSVTLAPCTDLTWYRDADGDGFGDAGVIRLYCTQPFGFVANNTDCDDANAEVNPNTVWYQDQDNDNYSNGNTLSQCTQPSGYRLPSALTALSGDCNDTDGDVNPGATEICNGIDDNCAGGIDENQNTITVTASGDGVVSPAGPVSLGCGQSQTFTIAANTCWEIADVVVNGTSIGVAGTYTFSNVLTDQTLEVVFTQRSQTITVNSVGNGSDNAPATVLCGGDRTINFSSDDCHYIASLVVNGTVILDGSEGNAAFNLALTDIQANQVIDVSYAIRQFNLTASVPAVDGTFATITPSGTITVDCGSSQSYTITADACTEILNVIVNGIGQGPVSTFDIDNIRQNQSITVVVARRTYTVTTSSGPGGAITPGGTQIYSCDDTPTFNISPSSNFGVVSVQVNGVEQGQIGTYTFAPLQSNQTISATFAPQPNNNTWQAPVPQIVPNFPSCITTSGTLAGCTPSPESSYFGAAAGAGQDAWYRFRVPDNTTGTVRIVATSTTNNIAIVLQREETVAPFYSAIAQENANAGVGDEMMTTSGLIPGAWYRLAVKNMTNIAPGSFSVCITNVRPTGCAAGMSAPRSLCDPFSGAYTGARSYTFTLTNTVIPAEQFVRTITGVGNGPAPSLISLSSIPGLRYGATYDVRIDATYGFVNGAGTTSLVTIPGVVAACQLNTIAQPVTQLSTNDWCANGQKVRSSVISTSWVCGVIDYTWEITPTIGLPVAVPTDRGFPERFMRVGSLNGINGGATTFNVRVRPVFSDGAGGRRNGDWGPSQQLCLVAPLSTMAEATEVTVPDAEPEARGPEMEVYPNPNIGESVQLTATDLEKGVAIVRILDIMGKQVYSKQLTVDSSLQLVLHPQQLSNGLYFVELITSNETRTRRLVIQK